MAYTFNIYTDENTRSWRSTSTTGTLTTDQNLSEMTEESIRSFFKSLTDKYEHFSFYASHLQNVTFKGGMAIIPPPHFPTNFKLVEENGKKHLEMWGNHSNIYCIYL